MWHDLSNTGHAYSVALYQNKKDVIQRVDSVVAHLDFILDVLFEGECPVQGNTEITLGGGGGGGCMQQFLAFSGTVYFTFHISTFRA